MGQIVDIDRAVRRAGVGRGNHRRYKKDDLVSTDHAELGGLNASVTVDSPRNYARLFFDTVVDTRSSIYVFARKSEAFLLCSHLCLYTGVGGFLMTLCSPP